MDGKPQISDKRARRFDFMQIFNEARDTAENRRHESDAVRAVEEGDDEGEGGDDSDRLKISCSIDGPSSSKVDSDDEIGPPLPPAVSADSGLNEGADDDGEDYIEYGYETGDVKELVPTGWEAVINVGKKPISALGVDSQGTRFMVGTYDYKIFIYDFPSMDSGLRPKRELHHEGCYPISYVGYACNGETLLVGTTDKYARLFNRNGKETGKCVEGDQYLVDKKNTKGHTSAITDAMWHPYNRDEFLTSSEDGTLRIWSTTDYKDITRRIDSHRYMIRVKTHGGMRAAPRCCAFTYDAKWIAAGCDDGSFQMWKNGKIFVNPHKVIRHAHSGSITSFAFSNDNKWLITRGDDDTMKLWSMSDLKSPVHVKKDLYNKFGMTSCAWSPHDELCVTGTSAEKRAGLEGKLVFVNAATFDTVYEIKYGETSAIRIVWHRKINQMFVGLSDGRVIIYYDERKSQRGVMACINKAVKRSQASEVVKNQIIIAPLTMEMFQPRGEEGQEKEVVGWRLRKLMYSSDDKNKKKFRTPALRPLVGGSAQGRVEEGGGSYIGHVLRGVGLARNRQLREGDDVRASILKHADEAAANPIYNTMYKDTQPVPIFQEYTEETPEQPSEELEPVHKKTKLIT